MKTNLNKSPGFEDFAKLIISKRRTHSYTASLKEEAEAFVNELMDFLFPHCSGRIYFKENEVIAKIHLIERDLTKLLLQLSSSLKENASDVSNSFVNKIPEIHDKLWCDAKFIMDGDPAAESIDEVILAYPGFKAIAIYRIAHELYRLNVPIIPRIISEFTHSNTGIDIHPGAEIESPFFIDHGTGIVIGETSKIGKNVKIYQGVTLGALSVEKSLSNIKRHPTIEDDVIIYAQSVILGGKTIIGKASVVGGNSWITNSIDPNSVVYNKVEVRVKTNKEFEEPINFII